MIGRSCQSPNDPLQKIWLSRFGRTVAGHVVDAVAGRLSGPSAGMQVTLGGQSIGLSGTEGDVDAAAAAEGGGPAARSMTGRELLLGSAFHLAGDGDAGGPAWAAWGRVTAGGFDAKAPAENGTVRMDGEVTTGILGADAAWERWLAGVALSVSEGEGDYSLGGCAAPSRCRGTLESSLTAVHPYVRVDVNDRVSAWGLLGYGTGEMTMTQDAVGNEPETVTRTDIEMRLGAAGARGALLEAADAGGFDLALRGDAFLVQMESAAGPNTVKTRADASRVRLVLEGGRSFEMAGGAVLTLGLELGLRHDGGDAETGTGGGGRRERPLCRPGERPDGGGERAAAARARGRRLRGMGRVGLGAPRPRRLGAGSLAHARARHRRGVERGGAPLVGAGRGGPRGERRLRGRAPSRGRGRLRVRRA